METSLIIISILSLLLFIDNFRLRKDLRETSSQLEDAKKSANKIMEILPGDKVTFDYELSYTKTNQSFSVTYEADVVEVADDKIKVKPYAVSNRTTVPNGVSEQSIVLFMTDKWVDRKEVSIIRDQDDIRDRKLETLGIK